MVQYPASTAWAYNNVVSSVRKGEIAGSTADALGVFNANWIKDADGAANLYFLEAFRGVVPFGIVLARLAWDNPPLYINRRGLLGGRAAGGLAMQRVQDYRAFDLEPTDGANSIALLIYRLREIAERRLDQYRRIWDNGIFGQCPEGGFAGGLSGGFLSLLGASSVSCSDARVQSAMNNYPFLARVPTLGASLQCQSLAQAVKVSNARSRLGSSQRNFEAALKEAGWQYVGELIAPMPNHRFAPGDVLCGNSNPPAFWPATLAGLRDFWVLVLLEERTSMEVGDKIWKSIIAQFGPNGQGLPTDILVLLKDKSRLFSPRLDVELQKIFTQRPQDLSGANFDLASLQAEARQATGAVNSAGFLPIPQNKVGWIPGGDGFLKSEGGTVRKFRDVRTQATVRVPVELPGWSSASEEWAALSHGGLRTPAPSTTSGPLEVPGEELIPAPRTLVKRGMATWKKLTLALSVGTAGLLGLYYWSTHRKGKT